MKRLCLLVLFVGCNQSAPVAPSKPVAVPAAKFAPQAAPGPMLVTIGGISPSSTAAPQDVCNNCGSMGGTYSAPLILETWGARGARWQIQSSGLDLAVTALEANGVGVLRVRVTNTCTNSETVFVRNFKSLEACMAAINSGALIQVPCSENILSGCSCLSATCTVML